MQLHSPKNANSSCCLITLDFKNVYRQNPKNTIPKWTKSRNKNPELDKIQNRQNLESDKNQNGQNPNRQNPEWTKSNIGRNPKLNKIPKGKNPEWTKSRIGQNLEWARCCEEATLVSSLLF